MNHTCPHCGKPCKSMTKLSDWEVEEITARATRVMAEWPRMAGRMSGPRSGRISHLTALADEYGINLRTLYRYLERTERAA